MTLYMFHQVNFDEKDDSFRENNSVPNGPVQNVFFFQFNETDVQHKAELGPS